MLYRSSFSPIKLTCLAALGFMPMMATAQGPLRAQAVEEDLQTNTGQDFFNRAKNIYDSAQASADIQTRRTLYLRSADIFSAYVNEFPNHPNAEAAWWYLGSSYYQAGLVEDAKRSFSTLIKLYGRGKYAAAASYTLAADHYNKREYAFAAPLFEKFAQSAAKPGDAARGNLFAGNCYRLLGRDREAIAAFKRVVADPQGAIFRDQAKLAIAQISMKAGKFAEALQIFEEIAGSDTSAKIRGDAALQAAVSATKLNKTDVAEKYLRYILNTPGMDDFRPDAQTALMENHYKKKEYKEVLSIFSRSSTKAEGEKEAMRLMIAGRAMVKLNDPTRASLLFRDIERLVKPENELAFQASFYRLNCFYKIEGRHMVDQINAFLEIYGKFYPTDTRIHTAMLMKAETLFSEGEMTDAAQVYTQIDETLLAESNRAGFVYQRGWCYAEAGDLQGAIRSLGDFIKKYPEDKRVYPALVKRAKAYSESGEPARAIADYDMLINDKSAPGDLVSLAWLESARTRRKEGNIENMLIRYKGLLENVRDLSDNLKAEGNYWIGWGMVKTNQPKEASPFLNKARDLRPDAYEKHAGLLLALSYFAAQDPQGLSKEINIAIKEEYSSDIPDQAIQWSGMQSYNAGDFKSAANFLALVANENEPRTTPKEVWRYLAKALIETGSAAKALPAIANVLEVEENASWKADALLDRGRALYELTRYAESRKAADEALGLRPQGRTSAGLRILSGDLHLKEGNEGQSGADYLYVIQFHEDTDLKPLAIHKYIGVLEKQGKAAEATKFKTQLASDFPNWKAP
ncbi:tetratricopeptide repeat protein [Luteolibacter sp. AS25]|uniref:tetratricopeptide repeat protein n=1 Tax=Luteolibacter sp. AS25 TaxID=3135776 RepID=UPI00398A8F8B